MKRAIKFFIGLLICCAADIMAQPQGPIYGSVRYEDDYSFLVNGRGSDPFNQFKKIPAGGSVELTFGGQYRFRFEHDANRRFGASNPPSQSFYLNRLYVFGDLRLGRRARLFGEFKYAGITDNELPAALTAHEKPDLQNFFAEIWLRHQEHEKVSLRAGRQELLFGKQRLIGLSDWANSRRTFDAIRLLVHPAGWKFDAFVAHPLELNPDEINKTDRSQTFAGVYAQRPTKGRTIAAYYLTLHEDDPLIKNGSGSTGNFIYHTLGFACDGAAKNFDWTGEAAYQFGDFGGDDIRAYMAAVEGGYTFARLGVKPRLGLGLNLASGDVNPADARKETFNPLFPASHPFLGWADQVGRQNIKALEAMFSLTPYRRFTAKVHGHKFFLANTHDAFYNAGGAATRREASGAAGDDAGFEIDAELTFNVNVHAKIQLGYARFVPGEFIKKTGPSTTHNLIYVMAPFTF